MRCTSARMSGTFQSMGKVDIIFFGDPPGASIIDHSPFLAASECCKQHGIEAERAVAGVEWLGWKFKNDHFSCFLQGLTYH